MYFIIKQIGHYIFLKLNIKIKENKCYLPTRIDVNNAKELCTVISFISTRDKTSPKIIGLLEEQHKAINTPRKKLKIKNNFLD